MAAHPALLDEYTLVSTFAGHGNIGQPPHTLARFKRKMIMLTGLLPCNESVAAGNAPESIQ